MSASYLRFLAALLNRAIRCDLVSVGFLATLFLVDNFKLAWDALALCRRFERADCARRSFSAATPRSQVFAIL
jgi:hypothetical protein